MDNHTGDKHYILCLGFKASDISLQSIYWIKISRQHQRACMLQVKS